MRSLLGHDWKFYCHLCLDKMSLKSFFEMKLDWQPCCCLEVSGNSLNGR